MLYLLYIIAALLITAGWVSLVGYETRTGVRFMSTKREHLDRVVERAKFLLEHIDFGAFARDETRILINRVTHNSAEATLQAVRATERFLTRIVRTFRSHQVMEVHPNGNAREFVKRLSEFKGSLQGPPSDVHDIQ